MKKPAALLAFATLAALILSACTNITPAFAGLNVVLSRLERDGAGPVTATLRFVNPNLAAYNVGKSVHRVALDGANIGTIAIERPFGIPPQTAIEQTAELRLGGGDGAFAAALARGSAAYRLESTLTFQLLGDSREVIRSASSGTVPVAAK